MKLHVKVDWDFWMLGLGVVWSERSFGLSLGPVAFVLQRR